MQLVLRPTHEFRGYAGQIVSGTVRPGDAVTVWPSGRTTRVKRIVTWDGDLDVARVADVGDADARGRDRHQPRRHDRGRRAAGRPARSSADVVWMDERPLDPARVYLLKHTTRTVTRGSRSRAGAEPDRLGDGLDGAADHLRPLRARTAAPAASS